jgi:hypothetical protein
MLSVDLFVEMHELCRTCSDDHVSEYQAIDLMIDAETIARMKKGERLYWFAHKNGTHCNNYLQTLERLQEFYTEPTFAEPITPIYVIDCVSDDDYEFYPQSDLYN